MARIAIDAALGTGFSLIRRQPGAVLLWGLVDLVFFAVNAAFFGSFYLVLVAQFAANARLGPEAYSQTMNVLAPQIVAVQGWSWLLSIVGLLVGTILYCAAFRAVLHPEQKRFGYLRLGATELLLFVLAVGAYIVFIIASLLIGLVAGLILVALFAMHAGAVGGGLAVLVGIAALVASVWIALRFSMVGPMMVADGKFHLFDSWVVTRGRAGVLFILAICLVVVVLVAELVIFGALIIVGLAVVAPAAGGMANLPSFFARAPSAVGAALAPVLIVAAVILTPLWGCLHAVLGAPWARAYLDLTEPGPAAIAA